MYDAIKWSYPATAFLVKHEETREEKDLGRLESRTIVARPHVAVHELFEADGAVQVVIHLPDHLFQTTLFLSGNGIAELFVDRHHGFRVDLVLRAYKFTAQVHFILLRGEVLEFLFRVAIALRVLLQSRASLARGLSLSSNFRYLD